MHNASFADLQGLYSCAYRSGNSTPTHCSVSTCVSHLVLLLLERIYKEHYYLMINHQLLVFRYSQQRTCWRLQLCSHHKGGINPCSMHCKACSLTNIHYMEYTATYRKEVFQRFYTKALIHTRMHLLTNSNIACLRSRR